MHGTWKENYNLYGPTRLLKVGRISGRTLETLGGDSYMWWLRKKSLSCGRMTILIIRTLKCWLPSFFCPCESADDCAINKVSTFWAEIWTINEVIRTVVIEGRDRTLYRMHQVSRFKLAAPWSQLNRTRRCSRSMGLFQLLFLIKNLSPCKMLSFSFTIIPFTVGAWAEQRCLDELSVHCSMIRQ